MGNFVVGWMSRYQDGGDFGVFAQRFGGLRPAALAVDTAGNRVLEPGETVALRPSWTNSAGAPQTFSGHLSNFTGPAGAAYAIPDPAGDYGTVADGATGKCGDCYPISVSDPATRPVAHWDTVAVERSSRTVWARQAVAVHVGRSFTDVPPKNPFYRFTETLLHHRITGGCSPALLPGRSTTRGPMAVFILVAKEPDTSRRPARRRCSRTSRARARSAAGSRSSRARGGRRLRERQLLPGQPGQPRADGGVPRADAEPA